ncbi:MAG: energy-coupled thiamine transporter ThiT [Clostridiales bacterium]|nr:energy-coupled thiamine transporter ThiT [Clostridiales bacterium]
MTTANRRTDMTTRMLVESAVLIGIATVLNEFIAFKAPWAFGGSVTLGSMLPLVLISWRWGTRQGLFSAFVFALLQMMIGFSNVTYGQNITQMVGIALLDYVLAYTSYGLARVFRGKIKNDAVALGAGIVLVGALRFVCHFLSGWMIWDALWPNEHGLSGAVYSLIYNGGYIVPDVFIAVVAGLLLFVPMRRYWLGEDVARR